MSDFDNFFAKKLGEEGNYPRRDKNWKALSKRLDAFDTGLHHNTNILRRSLRYWQAAAACAVIAGGLLAWNTTVTHRKNEALEKEITILRDKNRSLLEQKEITPAPSENIAIQKEPSIDNGQKSAAEYREGATGTINVQKAHANENHILAPSNIQTSEKDLLKGTAPVQSAFVPNASNEEPVLKESIASPDPVSEKGADTTANPSRQDTKGATQLLPPRSKISTPLLSLSKKNPVVKPLPLADKPVASSEMIKPAPNPSRFRAGIELLAGSPLPKDKGVSWLTGYGVTAEYNAWRSFWITASADWMKCNITSSQFLPKYHPHHKAPNPPNHGGGGGNPPKNLVEVESTQRRQELNLGLRYALPWRFWVRPSLSIQHTWVRTSPELISFKFEEPPHGGGSHGNPDPDAVEYIVQNTDAQYFGNIWKFGAGLEYETKQWAFGVKAEYSNNFAASDITFDALLFKAGIQYTFN